MLAAMNDARLDELRFLARLERERMIVFPHPNSTDSELRIAIHLLAAGVVNDATATTSSERQEFDTPARYAGPVIPYRERVEHERWKTVGALYLRETAIIRATHASAVRLAELEQSIQRGRLRDPTGILIDGRHAKRDLQVALFSASPTEPVSVAFLDMNGLKSFNDDLNHDAGDEAIRAFFEVVADVIAEVGEAHRVGGDEVVITMPRTPIAAGTNLLRAILRGLAARTVRGRRLSAAAGIACSSDPVADAKAVRTRADENQKRAKVYSKTGATRFAALAIDGEEGVEKIEPDVS